MTTRGRWRAVLAVTMLATALAPVIGYDAAAKLAKDANIRAD